MLMFGYGEETIAKIGEVGGEKNGNKKESQVRNTIRETAARDIYFSQILLR